METESHQAEIIRQFTLQAAPFAAHRAHSEEEPFALLGEFAGLDGSQRVLDAGCGPGLVACYFSSHAKTVTGLDVTEAMLEQGRMSAAKQGLGNVSFVRGNIASMPFNAGEFDAATSRYVFHHLEAPEYAFAEMVRVTRSGGRIVVMDACPPASKRAAYDAFEKRRDSSHTSALIVEEMLSLGERQGLGTAIVRRFGLTTEFASLVDASFPEEDRRTLQDIVEGDVGHDELGLAACMKGGQCHISFPIAVFAWTKP